MSSPTNRTASRATSALVRVPIDVLLAETFVWAVTSFVPTQFVPPTLEQLATLFGAGVIAYVGKELRERGVDWAPF